MKLFFFALRLLRRDARAGELYGLLAALVIAVAALSAVGFFTDRVRQALEREASQMLGADLLLIADHAWSPEVANAARAQGLRVAQSGGSHPCSASHGQTGHLSLHERRTRADGHL